ncbi:hypothetical protein [Streptomyces sp. E11-3]|uniref:hypothetical protein n=1 Tax=Streptomyces sp. E11-3 TaxID=3110112 RepID=UPI00397FD8A5
MTGLDIPHPFSIDALCGRVAEQRGRPLHRHPLPREAGESGVCGLWLATSSDDYVFYEAQTSLLHQEHIVLHEIGHILFGHNTLDPEDINRAQPLLPDLEPAHVQQLLGRTNYSTRQEQEAEMLASLIRMNADTPHSEQPQPRGVLAKLESALGVRESDVH